MRFLVVLLISLLIVACGQKGPLRHPEPPPQEEPEPEGEDERDDAEEDDRRDP